MHAGTGPPPPPPPAAPRPRPPLPPPQAPASATAHRTVTTVKNIRMGREYTRAASDVFPNFFQDSPEPSNALFSTVVNRRHRRAAAAQNRKKDPAQMPDIDNASTINVGNPVARTTPLTADHLDPADLAGLRQLASDVATAQTAADLTSARLAAAQNALERGQMWVRAKYGLGVESTTSGEFDDQGQITRHTPRAPRGEPVEVEPETPHKPSPPPAR